MTNSLWPKMDPLSASKMVHILPYSNDSIFINSLSLSETHLLSDAEFTKFM